MSPRWRKVFRDLSSHWFRTGLVVLSIAIGVFAVGTVLGTRQVLLREFDADYAASVPANVTYRAGDFGDELVRKAAAQPGVLAAQARRTATFRYRWAGAADDRTIEVDAFRDFNDLAVTKVVPVGEGSWPPRTGEIVLEAAAKQVGDYAVGDMLEVERADGKTVKVRVAGFAHDINAIPAQFIGYETGYVSFDTMEDLGETSRYNQLSLAFSKEDITWAEASRLATRVRTELFGESGVRVYHTRVPEPGSHFLGDIFRALSLLLLAMGVLALGLSAFLVVNTVSAAMAQQVRQVGIMKAIGGSASQLESLYVVAVAAYGVLALAVGMPGTAAGTRWFADFAARILNFRVIDYSPPSWVVFTELAVGLVVPLVAAAGPVRRGVRMSVVRALNATGMTDTHFGHGIVDRVLGIIRGLPRPVALSLRNTFLRKGRLALTLSTLTLASAVVMSVFSVRASIEHTITDLESWWNYDVQVSLAKPEAQNAIEDDVLKLRGVTGVDSWRTYNAAVIRADGSENESFTMIGLDPKTDFVRPKLVVGRWLEAGDTDAVVINTDAQNEEAVLALGKRVTMDVRGVEHTWRVVGVIRGQLSGPAVFCSERELVKQLGDTGVTGLLVRGTASDPASQRLLLTTLEEGLKDAGYPMASARTTSGMADQLREELGILVAFLVIMAALLATVGVIGLTGTMTINVLESTREIGVMRATGAQHSAIYQIFVTEGVTVGAIAWSAGALLAYPMSVGLVRALEQSIGIPLSYSFSWTGVGAWLLLMLLISAIASMAPAFRASQVSVRDAIAYE